MPVESGVAERDSNIIIEQQLDYRLGQVEKAADVDLLTFMGPLFPPADEQVKDAVEAIEPKRRVQPKRRTLMVILETDGGLIDVAERMARIFRHHYRRVDFVIPSYAMSAGTVLVMSGDSIHMDYASILGPIDPQVRKRGGGWVPALGYLEQFERLIEKSRDGDLTTAEMTYLIQNFDPAELYRYEQERELSIALLEEWLVKFKFKNWKLTETRGLKVNREMKVERAKRIGRLLNKTDKWHSHSRGISMNVLRRDLNLRIDDFGADQTLGPAISNYYRLLRDYQMRRGHYDLVIHTRDAHVGF